MTKIITNSPLYNALPAIAKEGIDRDVDGYYYYWHTGYGSYSADHLRQIADALDEINKPWDDEIKEVIGAY